MDKKIGNYGWLFVLGIFISGSVDAEQKLKLRIFGKDRDKPVTKLACGVPYTLEIQADGSQDLYNCKIPGLENFYHEFCGASHLNLMSHITTVHTYVIRADTCGTFAVGPLHLVTDQGTSLISNTLTLQVEQQEQSDVFVEMVLEKNQVVAGQRVTGKIRFCTSIDVQLLNVQAPIIDAAVGSCIQKGEPQQSRIIRDGISYDCYEFPIEIMLKNPGNYSFPKVGALCRVAVKKQRFSWGFNITSHNFEDQWYYENKAVELRVDPLPLHQHPVDVVGRCTKVDVTIDHVKARMGEGMVLTLHLEGTQGIEDFKQPVLQLPSGLKYYESKSFMEPLPRGGCKKSHEYIVQGIQEGAWEIPPQIITFFDTETKSYKTVQSKPLVVTITPGSPCVVSKSDIVADGLYGMPSSDDDICSLCTDGPWYFIPERSIAWPWLFVAFIVPLLAVGYGIFKRFTALQPEYLIYKRKKYAFKQLKKNLRLLKKNDSCVQLYDIFNQFFADRCQISLGDMNADHIEKVLKGAGFVANSIEQWNRFFHQLAEYAFCKKSVDNFIACDLFNRAQMWISQLEERL